MDFIWPPTCPICSSPCLDVKTLCPHCWGGLDVLRAPQCEFCGQEVEGVAAPICPDCFERGRPWDYGTSALRYSGVGRSMILRLKNMRSEGIADIMAKIAVEEFDDFFADIDVLVPIPLHWTRAIQRGFNQAGLLAYHISRRTGCDLAANGLKRRRITKKQTRQKDYEGRFANLENAFALGRCDKLRGKRVCLVDDVLTSGASFENASLILREAEPSALAVFAFARAKAS